MERAPLAALLLIFSAGLAANAWSQTAPEQEIFEPLHGPLPLSEDDHTPMAEHLRRSLEITEKLKARAGNWMPLPEVPTGDPEEFALQKRMAGELVTEYIAALRATDFSTSAPTYLHELPIYHSVREHTDLGALALTGWTHQEKELHRALIDQLLNCRPHHASFHAATLVAICSNDTSWDTDADNLRDMIKVLLERQPHLLHYWSWNNLIISADMLGMRSEATALAQAVALAPLAGSPPRIGLPHYQANWGEPRPDHMRLLLAGPLLVCGMRDHPDEFISRLLLAARRDPEDHDQIAFWMKARAFRGILRESDLDLAKDWGQWEMEVRMAEILATADPHQSESAFDAMAIKTLGDFFEGRGEFFLSRSDQREICSEARLKSKTPGVRKHIKEHLEDWIKACQPTAQKPCPGDVFQDLFLKAREIGSISLQGEIVRKWIELLELSMSSKPDFDPQYHSSLMAETALLASPPMGERLAHASADLLLKFHSTTSSRPHLSDTGHTRAVFRAMMSVSLDDHFSQLCTLLDGLPSKISRGESLTLPMQGAVAEVRSLQAVLLRQSNLPMAQPWVRSTNTGSGSPEIAWEYMAPVTAPTGLTKQRLAGVDGICLDAWGKGNGLRSSLLERLRGAYEVSFEFGTSTENLRPRATVLEASASGVKTLNTMPPKCGYVRSVVRDRSGGKSLSSAFHPYSLEASIVASGPEPTGACGSSFLAPQASPGNETLAFEPLKFLPIDPNQPCLLTVWNAREFLVDGTSEYIHPLDSIRLAFATESDVSHISAYFDISSIAASGSGCFQAEVFTPAALASFFAFKRPPTAEKPNEKPIRFVTVLYSKCGRIARTPLFQLRPFVLPKPESP